MGTPVPHPQEPGRKKKKDTLPTSAELVCVQRPRRRRCGGIYVLDLSTVEFTIIDRPMNERRVKSITTPGRDTFLRRTLRNQKPFSCSSPPSSKAAPSVRLKKPSKAAAPCLSCPPPAAPGQPPGVSPACIQTTCGFLFVSSGRSGFLGPSQLFLFKLGTGLFKQDGASSLVAAEAEPMRFRCIACVRPSLPSVILPAWLHQIV